MKASEVIREGRNVLFERGWTTGILESRAGGSVCLEGALSVAMYGNADAYPDEQCDALKAVRAAIGDEEHISAVWLFNDAPERTFDDVIDALDRAEKIAEQRESDV